jgi:dephospho-CoA kinase
LQERFDMRVPRYVVGITGGIGSGKSAVTDYLETKGITVVDADKVARIVVEPGTSGLAAIAKHFGQEILLPDGGLNRAALRKVVFDNPDERKVLEGITHPRIREEIARQLSDASSPYVVLASPLLLESGQNSFADYVVVVDVPESVQLNRTMARDDNSEQLVKSIMAAQLDRKTRLSRADTSISNDGTLEALYARVDDLHESLLARAGA